jgi:hypothetical protein
MVIVLILAMKKFIIQNLVNLIDSNFILMANSYRLGTVHTNYLTPTELQTEFRDYKLKVLNGEINFKPTLKEKYKDGN